MHVGGVRTALYAWLYARKNNGTFILRIEDTDKAREVEGSIPHIIESLKWLGIEWDEGPDIQGPHAPYLQSERLDSYKKYVQILVDKGYAYADPYSEEELEQFRKKAEEEHRPFLYRDHRPEHPPVWNGTQPLRLKISELKTYRWHDLVRGELSAGPEALDDFILIKSDGYPTYNLAHIIDDLEMGVTHIMRADEFISSTPKYLALYEALGITRPEIATLPPIMGPDGKKKLSKRDGAKDILDYRDEGYLPEAVMNFLAFIGWNPGGEKEIYSKDELIAAFDISKIHVSGAKFNQEKLDWFNREYIKQLDQRGFWDHAHVHLYGSIVADSEENREVLKKLEPLIRERMVKFSDMLGFFGRADGSSVGEFDYFFVEPVIDTAILPWKGTDLTEAITHLKKTLEILNPLDAWTSDEIKNAVMPYAESVGKGNALWPFRVALSGREKSPDPFEVAAILGKEKTFARLQKVLNT